GGLAITAGLLGTAARLLPDSTIFFSTAVTPGAPRLMGAAGLTRIGAAMIDVDTTALAFGMVASVVTALLVGLLPALQASRLHPVTAIKTGGTSSTRGFRLFDSRAVLVRTEVAISLVRLSGACLMLKSAQRLLHTRIGVDATNVLSAEIALPDVRYNHETGAAFQGSLVERLSATPGVGAVGWGYCMPVSAGCNATFVWSPPASQAQPSPTV